MRAYRGMSQAEFEILIDGSVNQETAPFAVIAADEELTDTLPRPENGTLCLFPNPSFLYPHRMAKRFGNNVVEFDVPESCIVGFHEGEYLFTDMVSGEQHTEIHGEITVSELRPEWIINIEVALVNMTVTAEQFYGDADGEIRAAVEKFFNWERYQFVLDKTENFFVNTFVDYGDGDPVEQDMDATYFSVKGAGSPSASKRSENYT